MDGHALVRSRRFQLAAPLTAVGLLFVFSLRACGDDEDVRRHPRLLF
jgi:hypothetical protein